MRLPARIRQATIRPVVQAGAAVVLLLAHSVPAFAVDYQTDIKPLLKSRCFGCHGALQHEAGLRLDAISLIRTGGDSGASIMTGDAAASLLFQRVSASDPAERMPPDGSGVEPLSAEEIKRVRDWIDAGAIAPDEPVPPDPREHWAFKPVARPDVPAGDSVAHPIDAFVRARLKAEGLSPSPEADRATLLRRLSFDLLGLPPTPVEVKEFLADDQPDAWERLVDRLLASPHFGERWGKHWLDVARYADTDGYSGEQYRPWAWRWRDWVIDSFNSDQPYDEFTINQLAGDLLPDATLDERIATGFHRNALHSRETDADPEEFRVRKVVECVNVTGAAWLGLTVGCAQCHSHKFDPISHSEYFGLYAFFNSTDEIELPAPLHGDAAAFAETSLTLAALPKPEGTTEQPPTPPQTMAPILQQRAEARVTHVQLRGDFLSPGDEVQAHTPAVLPALSSNGVATRFDLAQWLVSSENPLTSRVAVNRAWQHLFGRGLVRTENDFGTQGTPPSHPELLDWIATEFHANQWSRKRLIRTIVTSATYKQSAALTAELAERDPENRLLARQNRVRHEAEILRDAALSAAGLLDTQIGGPSFRPPVPPDAGNVVELRWKSEPTPDRYRRGVYIVVQRNVQLPFLMTFDAPDGNTFCTRRERSNTPPQALTLLNDPFFFECATALGRRLANETTTDDERIALAFLACASREPTADESLEFQAFLREQRQLLEHQPELAATLATGAPVEQATAIALWTSAARVLMNTDEFVCRE